MSVSIDKAVEYMNKYGICKNCGNGRLGNGEGTMEIDTVKGFDFIRTCKCGWRVEIKSSEGEGKHD
jgi:hypothetical protein